MMLEVFEITSSCSEIVRGERSVAKLITVVLNVFTLIELGFARLEEPLCSRFDDILF